MLGGLGAGKKVIRRRQEQRYLEGHLDRIRNVRPSTTDYLPEQIPRILNNSKKVMLLENKFTEIQRENRLLLQKITSNLIKRPSKQIEGRQRMNKSLHSNFRKKQLVDIEIQNARLLKRLQQKKSQYETHKLKQEWKKQKAVIKNIANYPLIIGQGGQKERRRSFSKGFDLRPTLDKNKLTSDIQMMRIRTIDGVNMIITIRLSLESLTILADVKNAEKEMKIIQVPREEALQFIEEECDGRIEGLFDRLSFDPQGKILYLLSKQAQLGNPEQNEVEG